MKTVRPCTLAAVVVVSLLLLMPQESHAGTPQLPAALAQKIASGSLIRSLTRTIAQPRTSSVQPAPTIMTAIYSSAAPSDELLARLSYKGARAFPETWTPPSAHHPLGFFLAQVPASALTDVLSIDAVKKMDAAECEAVPQSNEAARSIKANLVWSMGITGSGVKVGVIDSGLDISFAGNELPASLQKRDYSLYPSIDTTVANTATGHGTHVTGILLGRGVNSVSNIANGGGAYKGMAPAADLVFLKIGIDGSGGASESAEIAAIHAAVDSFHVKVINLSYGGWEAFHDGSGIVSQAIDWAFDQGVSCFVAAGNFANAGRHASGYVMPRDTSDFIQVNVGTSASVLHLAFNLVYADGAARSGLSLLYYDSAKTLLANTTQYGTYESPRGTESQLSQFNDAINRSGTYYLRVVNPSPMTQVYHLYENNGAGFVQFAYPDPKYTITTPGDADGAFTVGAYSAHNDWVGMEGGHYTTGVPVNSMPSFSGQGPRVDGLMKPNLVAPGCMIISLRDRDVFTAPTLYCVDDDGVAGGAADYYVMQGTSMATPVAAGAAALLLQQDAALTPQQIYDALMQNVSGDSWMGPLPNPMCGFGRLNVFAALQTIPLPVELASFSSALNGQSVVLTWRTETETKNYGFEIERNFSAVRALSGAPDPEGWVKAGFVPGSGTSARAHDYAFTDHLGQSGTVAYRLKQIDADGRFVYSRVLEVRSAAAPAVFALAQNYPNPFNPSTTFQFSIASAAPVRLSVFDLLGRRSTVVLDRVMEAGLHRVEWNASALSSGVYFYRLESGTHQETRKLIIQK